ncbi:hypothetical protein LTR36_007409 [Oleoguttula mirabilis]|uniref:Mediator complex subunit 15 KIX domain-containing protein n=1 Tax=Oleoguttula mirabilis TaxID=1507867 RepID=A0AAV9JA28_9PEZI|nr:hypothetical protein LTR36_007409 [Oleoguttula mirabilis]
MEQAMPPQNVAGMQRAQQGNISTQLHAKILHDLQQTLNMVGTGWQSTFDPKQRAMKIMQLVSGLRLLNPDVQSCLRIAMPFELRTVQHAPSRDVYDAEMKRKLDEITAKRAQHASMQMPNGMQMDPNMALASNMQNNGMANMNLQNGGMSMPNGQANGNAAGQQNTGFPAHLQRQMKPSQLALAQHPGTMDPSALQSQSQIPEANQVQHQQPPNRNPGGQGAASQVDPRDALAFAHAIYDRMPEDQKTRERTNWLAGLNDQQRAQVAAASGTNDPLLHIFLVNQARNRLAASRYTMQPGQGQQPNTGGLPMGNQQNMMGGDLAQPPVSQAGAPGIDYSSIMGQQASALKQQESGEQVVPASNNVSFNLGAAGMNMPQAINPQMLGNQQGSNPQLTNQMQQIMMQQQKQQMMQRQNVLAQQQALHQQQQANQLRGQPGGLNAPNALNGGPAGQVNSPAMSMLNRPIALPGQVTPGTPQPNRAPGQPAQTPQNAAAMNLMQHHQHMIGQNSQGANPSTQQQNNQQEIMKQLLQSLPVQLQQHVIQKRVSMDGLRSLVLKWRQQQQINQQNGNMLNAQPGQSGVPNMGMNVNAQPQMNGMQDAQGNATPMFNSQPPPNQQPPAAQMDQAQLQQRLQAQHQHQQGLLRQRAMDSRPFPKLVLTQIGVSVPQDVQSWGKLKNHLMQNQSVLPPQVMEKVRAMQQSWFETHPEEMNLASQALRQHMQLQQQQQQGQRQQGGQPQPQQPPMSGPPSISMQNGQAPPAQMVPPAAPMQQPQAPNQDLGPQGMNQGQLLNVPPPTMQEVQAFREQYVQAAGHADEQIRSVLWNKKRRQVAQQMQLQAQQQEALRNAQIQRAQAAAGQQGGGRPNGAQGQRQPQQQQVPPGQQQPAGAQAQGQKRSQPPVPTASNDDLMEIPNPNAPPPAQMGAPQAPPMQPSKSQQQAAQQQASQQGPRGNMPTKEQMAQWPPEKRAQLMAMIQQKTRGQNEALRKAQMGISNNQQHQPPTQQPQAQAQQSQGQTSGTVAQETQKQQMQTLQALYKEVERSNPKGPAVEINEEGMQQAQALLKRLWQPTLRMQTTFLVAMSIPNFEKKLRGAIKARVQVMQNLTEEGMIKTYLSLSVQQLRELEGVVSQYCREVKAGKEMIDAERGQRQAGQQQQRQQNPQQMPAQAQAQVQAQTQAQQRPPSATTKPQHASQPAPPTPSERGHGRKASSNSKAPPAPTEHKTFDWGLPSPHGVPKYEVVRNNELTTDKLKFPPNKKRKPNQSDNSQDSTPAGQTVTPGAVASPNVSAKLPSPEQTRKQQQQVKQDMAEREREEQRKWRCNETLCEASITGYETEGELKRHAAAEHAPVEDPLAFLLDNAAGALGVDQAGKALPATRVKAMADVKVQPRATTVPGSRAGVKQEVATPPVPGPASKSKGKMAITAAPLVAAPAKEKTLREALEEQMGYKHFAETDHTDATMSDAPKVDIEDWRDMLQGSLSNGADVADWSSFGQHSKIDWGLPQYSDSSPDMTPSDGTASSRASDVSQSERLRINMEWDAFGNGDIHVPEALRMQTLGLGDVAEMGGGAAGKDGGGQDDEWDWSRDEEVRDWDTLFGPNAGLEDVGWEREPFL